MPTTHFNFIDSTSQPLSGSKVVFTLIDAPKISGSCLTVGDVIQDSTDENGLLTASFVPAVYKVKCYGTTLTEFIVNLPETGSAVNAADYVVEDTENLDALRIGSSFQITSSWANNSKTASYYGGSVTSASYSTSSSFARTASYVVGSATASFSVSSSNSLTSTSSSYALNANTARTASYTLNSVNATTASYVENAQSANVAQGLLDGVVINDATINAAYVYNSTLATPTIEGGTFSNTSFFYGPASFRGGIYKRFRYIDNSTVSDQLYISGDSFGQLSNLIVDTPSVFPLYWRLYGESMKVLGDDYGQIGSVSLDGSFEVLYWSIYQEGDYYMVQILDADQNIVAIGGTGNSSDTVTLTEENSSGISGTITISYSNDVYFSPSCKIVKLYRTFEIHTDSGFTSILSSGNATADGTITLTGDINGQVDHVFAEDDMEANNYIAPVFAIGEDESNIVVEEFGEGNLSLMLPAAALGEREINIQVYSLDVNSIQIGTDSNTGDSIRGYGSFTLIPNDTEGKPVSIRAYSDGNSTWYISY